jgi:hypothetical protein
MVTALMLREGVSFCRIGEQHIFLDLQTDRYFGLGRSVDQALARDLLEGSSTEIVRDALLQAGVLSDAGGLSLTACGKRPASRALPLPPRASHRSVLWALTQRLRWSLILRQAPLAQCVSRLQQRREQLPTSVTTSDAKLSALSELGRSYRQAGLIWSEHGRCLATSLALADEAIGIGVPAQLVFGIQLGPFQAHCWVEVQGMLVSERADRVAPFTPILVT